MERRSRRHDVIEENNVKKISRTSKNEYLYDDLNNKIGVENIVNLDNNSKINLSDLSNINNRETYHKVKDYKEIIDFSKNEKKVEDEPQEKKIYDINSILEDARKNRVKFDELERKRKLKENNYVSLANIDDKDQYKSNKVDEEELTNLINTITSHNLLKDIKEAEEKMNSQDSNEIFSDLLANEDEDNNMDGIAKEFTNYDEEEKIDDSFYTKSIDLSEQDFEFSNEIEQERKMTVMIVSIVVVILIVLLIVVFFILKSKNIIKL